MICPTCTAFLSNKATSCPCGWTKVSSIEERRAVPCAFDGCPMQAQIRRRVGKNNWANVCEKHDLELVQKEADEWMADVGLTRMEGESQRDWRRRCLDHLRQRAAAKSPYGGMKRVGDFVIAPRQREPGDDDDYVPPAA